MKRINMLLAACVLGVLPSVGLAQSASESDVAALRAEVAQLKANQARLEAAIQSGGVVGQTRDAVAKDAAARSALSPVLAGYDPAKGFILRSEDGNFSLHPTLFGQFRNITNYTADGREIENGFEVRRMKFGFDGNAFSPATTYLFMWQTDRNTGEVTLEEATVKTKLTADLYIRGGQTKGPFSHEGLVSSKKLLSSDRTLATNVLAGVDNYVQGLVLGYLHDSIQAEVAVTDGFNESNRNFQDFPVNGWNFGVAGRVQYKVFGDWSGYDQFTSLDLQKNLLVVGAGADLSQGGDTDQFLHTIDVQYNHTNGLGLYGALYGRYTQNGPKSVTATPDSETDRYDWGAIAQASYLIPQTKWEPFGRYDHIGFDDHSVAAGAEQSVDEFTVGVNYYAHGQNAKFTLDITYLPNGSPVADLGSDVKASSEEEIVLQLQFQLVL